MSLLKSLRAILAPRKPVHDESGAEHLLHDITEAWELRLATARQRIVELEAERDAARAEAARLKEELERCREP